MEGHTRRLIDAVTKQDISNVEALIEGPSETYAAADICDCLRECVKLGNEQIFDILVDKFKRKLASEVGRWDPNRNLMHLACVKGNISIVKKVFDIFFTVNKADNDGYRPLHIACKYNHPEVAKFLLTKGANIVSSKTFKSGFTPLHIAVDKKHVEVLQVLLESGRSGINERTSRIEGGYTPLQMAIMNDFEEGVELLCNFGADVGYTDCTKNLTALHFAAAAEKLKYIDILIKAGANPNKEGNDGSTPIFNAIYANRPAHCQALIEAGADVHHMDKESFTPLYCAVLYKYDEVVKVLLDAGANPNIHSPNCRFSSLLLCPSLDNPKCVEYLLAAGADVSIRSSTNSTVLHKCQSIRAGEARDKIVKMFLDAGVKINVTNKSGFTALYDCVFQSVMDNFSLSTMQLLVQAGAHVDIVGLPRESGLLGHPRNSPLCWLVWNQEFEAAEYLLRCDWNLRPETWIFLPGKTPEQQTLHYKMASLSFVPWSLSSWCRKIIRKQLLSCSEDTEILSRIDLLVAPGAIKRFLSMME